MKESGGVVRESVTVRIDLILLFYPAKNSPILAKQQAAQQVTVLKNVKINVSNKHHHIHRWPYLHQISPRNKMAVKQLVIFSRFSQKDTWNGKV